MLEYNKNGLKTDFRKYMKETILKSKPKNKQFVLSEKIDVLVCYKCYHCKLENLSEAYKCKEYTCPLYPIKSKYMNKPHKLSETQIDKQKEIMLNAQKVKKL